MAQTVSELWKTLWSTKNTRREYAFDIEGTWYGPEAEVEHKAESALYSDFGIGNASASSLSLNLFAENIPRGAQIKRYVRLVNGEQASEWLQHGLYWANRRGNDDGYWNIEAIDAMRKGDAEWVPDQSLEFPESGMPMTEAVEIIADLMGVELDPRTQINAAYTIDYPVSKQTLRKTLAWIAAAHGGNWVATGQWNEDTGRPYIRMVPLISAPVSTSYLVTEYGAPILIGGVRIRVGVAASGLGNNTGSKFYVGRNIVDFTDNGKYKPVSRVTLLLDDENSLTAGDDTGFEIVADCPYATQAMVDALLAQLRGYEYQSYEAGEANIDPSAELGDGVTVGGLYAVIGRIVDDGTGYPSLSAPGEAAVDDEYPGGGPMQQEFNRKIAETQSLITKTAAEIKLSVEGLSGDVTALSVKMGEVTIYDSQTGTTYIRGASIETGSITVDKLNITGSISWTDLATDAQNQVTSAQNTALSAYTLANRANSMAASANSQVSAWVYPGTTYINGSMIMTGTVMASYLQGGVININGANGYSYGVMYAGTNTEGSTAFELYGSYGLRLIGNGNVYIASAYGSRLLLQSGGAYLGPTVYLTNGELIASDRDLKHDIDYDISAYDAVFDGLKSARFKYNDGTSDRYHTALIAQDVKDAVLSAGLTTQDFAGYCEMPIYAKDEDGNDTEEITGYTCALRYDEFIALNIRQIQLLKARVAELEAKIL